MPDPSADKILQALVKVLRVEREAKGLNYEELGAVTGLHRTTLGLYERGERCPTIEAALQIAEALGMPLSSLIRKAEESAESGRVSEEFITRREVPLGNFRNASALRSCLGLSPDAVRAAILDCYNTLDTIDQQLVAHGAEPMARLVELANLSSMIGNLLGAGLASASNGLYRRNRPHAYPDLIPQNSDYDDLEIKVALEKNKPKGHLSKAGNYITFRYVLCNESGQFIPGKENRGLRVFIWEVKVGRIRESDFDLSNTEGDSGKTAVIKTAVFNAMPLIYFDPDLIPYARRQDGRYPGFN
jgi:transcriptional regulator with XRE-family HTH domain